MDIIQDIFKTLEKCDFKVSTDTRKDVSGSIYFALKGEAFDGNAFVRDALEKGAVAAVASDPKLAGEKIFIVEDPLKTLQSIANMYRKKFNIPIIAIGGSNGKTTTRELARDILKTRYETHSSEGNLNNHIGLPLSILSMPKSAEISIFEIGANHSGEHTKLLDILEPTHVTLTNNGLDHLEGFGSPEGVRKANEEIFDWARGHGAEIIERRKYDFSITTSLPLTFVWREKEYQTNLAGDYNIENIALALSVGERFQVPTENGIEAAATYAPQLKRSQIIQRGSTTFVIDCYNANPTSMILALESFFRSAEKPRGVILGDMLELGTYSDEEHRKIVDYVAREKPDCAAFIGDCFKKALAGANLEHHWFLNSDEAKKWFAEQNFDNFSLLLKGSRDAKVEKVLDM